MDDATRAKVQKRLKIVEGQIRGVQRMVEEDSYCCEVLTQIAAIQNALRGVGRELVRNHLGTCVTSAVKRGEGEQHFDELLDIMYKLNK